MSKHAVRGGDVAGLLERFAQLRKKARARTGKAQFREDGSTSERATGAKATSGRRGRRASPHSLRPGRTPLLKQLVILAIETGMRRGELLGLQWEHVQFAKRIVHLPLTKNGESRDVPLSRRATDTLAALSKNRQPNADLVFPMSGNSVRLAFEHLRARAKMSNFHFHDLRHEAITRLFERGLNIAEVSAISGHKELKMLQRYTHLRAIDLVSRLGYPARPRHAVTGAPETIPQYKTLLISQALMSY
jgi:integrase